jgi:transposase
MIIIGVDYHPSFQQIAFMDQETGECGERELNHSDGEAEKFYRELKQRGVSVRVGMEATGYSRWFERLLAELDAQRLPLGRLRSNAELANRLRRNSEFGTESQNRSLRNSRDVQLTPA